MPDTVLAIYVYLLNPYENNFHNNSTKLVILAPLHRGRKSRSEKLGYGSKLGTGSKLGNSNLFLFLSVSRIHTFDITII